MVTQEPYRCCWPVRSFHAGRRTCLGPQRTYLQEHNADPAATLAAARSAETTFEFVSFIPSSWLPPDVDDVMPSVDPSVPCNVKEVLQKSGQRIQELVANVDKFTATETVTHESFNKWDSFPAKKFKFNYVVSVEESRPVS